MSKLEIVKWPDPILSRKTQRVEVITQELVQTARDMLELMYVIPGIGLAANQVGIGLRFAVMDTRKRLNGKFETDKMSDREKSLPFPLLMFNPEILSFAGKTLSDEGCLSVPGYFDQVQRTETVRFQFTDENQELREYEVDGLTAVCVQHECDHLDGKVFLDRLTPIRRSMIKNKIKKYGYSQKSETSDL